MTLSVGAHSVYVGQRPLKTSKVRIFGQLREKIRAENSALIIGYRDPETGADTINPDNDAPLPDNAPLIYLAPKKVLPD